VGSGLGIARGALDFDREVTQVKVGAAETIARDVLFSQPPAVLGLLFLQLPHLGETDPLSQGVQAGGKALRKHRVNGAEVHKKRPRGFA
jgi:hypothetical protein